MTEQLIRLIDTFIMPPAINFIFILIGLLFIQKKLGKFLLGASLVTLYMFSTPFFADQLLGSLDRYPPAQFQKHPEAKAIVVLSGTTVYAPEYKDATSNNIELARLRYAAYLHKQTGLPILVSGDEGAAAGMQNILQNSFNVPVKFMETEASNTQTNASNSKRILEAVGIKDVFLVTSAWHMPRAMMAFESVGMNPIPASTDYQVSPKHVDRGLMQFVPRAGALSLSALAMHEYIGMVWYELRRN